MAVAGSGPLASVLHARLVRPCRRRVDVLAHWSETSDLVANAPIIMVELAPVTVAPQTQPTDFPPGPQQTEVEPEPQLKKLIEKVEIPPDRQAEPLLSVTPPKPVEKPNEKKPKETHASLTSAPSTAEQQAQSAAAPTPGAAS